MTGPALVGVDWGTSSFRAYLTDARGTVLDTKAASGGILQLGPQDFEAFFERELEDWFASRPDVPVIASGMIGSRQGWVEIPYVTCPTDLRGLAERLHPHATSRGRRLWFVPGLLFDGALPDVLRGEETEIIGAMVDSPGSELFVLPGTHSKWVRVAGTKILEFATYMTGEVFALLKTNSILGRLMQPGPFDAAAFQRGAEVGLDRGPKLGGVLHRCFSARTLGLTGRLRAEAIESYLSGLLIGTEIREAALAREAGFSSRGLVLVGGSELVVRYERVLALAGVSATSAAPAAAARGQFKLAQLAGLLD